MWLLLHLKSGSIQISTSIQRGSLWLDTAWSLPKALYQKKKLLKVKKQKTWDVLRTIHTSGHDIAPFCSTAESRIFQKKKHRSYSLWRIMTISNRKINVPDPIRVQWKKKSRLLRPPWCNTPIAPCRIPISWATKKLCFSARCRAGNDRREMM